jgi:hypothetical protein
MQACNTFVGVLYTGVTIEKRGTATYFTMRRNTRTGNNTMRPIFQVRELWSRLVS